MQFRKGIDVSFPFLTSQSLEVRKGMLQSNSLEMQYIHDSVVCSVRGSVRALDMARIIAASNALFL